MKATKESNTRNKVLRALLLGWLMVLAACIPVSSSADPTITPQSQIASREAQVQSVEIQVLQASPLQVNAIVRGNLTESCATLGDSQVQYASNTFRIAVYAVSPADRGCAQVITPFETTITLGTNSLPAGTYTVIANGVNAVFTLPIETAIPNTAVPANTAMPTAFPTAVPASVGCTDSAKFVSDVTIPDNSVVASNTAFTKTWRLKNTGTCTWDNNYLVAYISGTTMSQQPGYWIVQQGQTVVPGQTVDVSVGMTAPVDSGNYASYWGLKKVDGQFMPIQRGANGTSFYVKIKVNNGVAEGKITAQSISIELEQGSGTVCTASATYFVHASITADGATTATYEVGSTAGQIPAGYFYTSPTGPVSLYATGVVVFDQAGAKTIDLRFVGPYPYPDDITVNLRVNGGEWYNTELSCQ
ncbi:MAG TPA: NBR1-Ig-like domain-containing protein [Anaerolineales bacterium]|nr:NBR1-Ig-like domain-containing protein [Anaerolineales bacterium]